MQNDDLVSLSPPLSLSLSRSHILRRAESFNEMQLINKYQVNTGAARSFCLAAASSCRTTPDDLWLGGSQPYTRTKMAHTSPASRPNNCQFS